LTRDTATQRLNAIVENFKNDTVQFFERLTVAALERHPGLPLPAEELPAEEVSDE
jgi:hypothetical protein